MTERELVLDGWIDEIFDDPDEIYRANAINAAMMRAKDLDCVDALKRRIAAYKKTEREMQRENLRNYRESRMVLDLETDGTGRPMPTIANFLLVLRNDPFFSTIRFNELSRSPEKTIHGIIKKWTDADDADAREYIERVYKIHSAQKCDDALRIIFRERSYNPVTELIDSIAWDGVHRISSFLSKWMKCEDTPYTREVSRLIFAGGIHRIYNPGCKFDDTPVLIGTKQGEGKSTFVRWLAMRDDFFTEITEIEGQKGMEAVEGAWICEIGELLALTRAKDVEAVKSFMTRQVDHYRKPYDKRPTDSPRMCVFVGTTNKEQFLTDKTGNRRFYPVKVGQSGYELFDHKEEVKADIRQCWAEAKYLYDMGELLPYADRILLNVIREKQAESVEDDYRVGMIQAYLEDKTITCCVDIWQNALNNQFTKPSKRDSVEISLIMNNLQGWNKEKKAVRIGDYGPQKCWVRERKTEDLLPL